MRYRNLAGFGAALVVGAICGSLIGPRPAAAVAREIIELQRDVTSLLQGQKDIATQVTQDHTVMRTLIEPVYASFAMERVSDRYRATLSGFYSVTWSIGFSIGPSVAGWLQANVSLSTSFVFGAACLVVCPTLLLAFFGRR